MRRSADSAGASRALGRMSLSRRFVLISLIGISLVGFGVVYATARALQEQAVAEGTATAQSLASWTLPVVPVDAYVLGQLPTEDADALAVVVDRMDSRLISLRLWTTDGNVLFDSTSSTLSGFPDVDRLDAAALRGRSVAKINRHLTSPDTVGTSTTPTVLNVYVPVRYDGQLVGAAEIALDQTAAAAGQAVAVRDIGLAAALGLLLLWLVLFRTVHNASVNLQASAMDNARMALLDALTGLPNRRMLLDRLQRAVDNVDHDGRGVGILLLDLDRFKEINDSLGHDRGDELLVQVAERLQGVFRGRDLVARLGGDEFAVLLPGLVELADAEALAHRARAVFTEPFVLGPVTVHVATSIGVAVLPDHADDANSLMRKADIAMYTAKQHRLGVSVYDRADDGSSPARLVLQGELHASLSRPGELAVHYQPKIDLATGRTAGFEALVRWHHPTRGAVAPSIFIPLAEQSGLIDDLTEVVLRTVVEQLAAWHPAERLPIAVNLSAHSVVNLEIVHRIVGLLEEHDVAAEHLHVEITETALVADPGRVVPVLHALSAAGIRVAIDDFGIGSTSIAQLRDLPVDVLKIDQLFVADIRNDADSARAESVVHAMVDLAHSFGLIVVAEGVEDGVTAACLRTLDVDQAQGFWYSAAVPAAEALAHREWVAA